MKYFHQISFVIAVLGTLGWMILQSWIVLPFPYYFFKILVGIFIGWMGGYVLASSQNEIDEEKARKKIRDMFNNN